MCSVEKSAYSAQGYRPPLISLRVYSTILKLQFDGMLKDTDLR